MSLSTFKIIATLILLSGSTFLAVVFKIDIISILAIIAFLLSATSWAETLFIKLIFDIYKKDVKKAVTEILGGDDGSSGKSE